MAKGHDYLTVKELITQLQQYPDHYPVILSKTSIIDNGCGFADEAASCTDEYDRTYKAVVIFPKRTTYFDIDELVGFTE